MIIASGRLDGFGACYAHVRAADDGTATVDAKAAEALQLSEGDRFLAMGR
jgi:hypothetical protein